jgi:diadenosine tetraphosphate (Ap4A) HIT family hydrolase
LDPKQDSIVQKRAPGDLSKRAYNVFFSQAFKSALAYHNPKSILKGKYERSTACSTVITKNEGVITSRYCNSRWCNVCNRIKTGKLMNDHGDILDSLSNPFFVTLTIPNVPGDQLRNASKMMLSTFGRIIKTIQQTAKRKNEKIIVGFRKLECTHNEKYNDFHPHLHIIVDSEEAAQEIMRAWLEKYDYASPSAQDIRPASIAAAKELFKYVTKMLPNKKEGQSWQSWFENSDKTEAFFKAMDKIFVAFQGLRIIQSFGYESIKCNQVDNGEIDQEIEEVEQETDESEDLELKSQQYKGTEAAEDGKYLWNKAALTWINPETGEFLLDKPPDKPKLTRLVKLIYGSCMVD